MTSVSMLLVYDYLTPTRDPNIKAVQARKILVMWYQD